MIHRRTRALLRITFIAATALFYSASALAEESKDEKLPKWEIGVAGGIFSTPQYVGSDQRYFLPLAAPYLIYRGDILKADREGVRGELIDTKRFSIDVGFGFGLPVKNDNKARKGMDDLYLTGQVGPRLNWKIRPPGAGPEISFHLPVRYAWDTHSTSLGWVAEPYLKFEQEDMGKQERYSLRLDIGLLYAGKKYNDYYYGVDERFATPDRPAYEASAGLDNYFMNLIGSYRINDTLKLSALLRWKTLSGGTVEDSPLVLDENYLVFGLGFIKTLKKAR